MIREEALEAKKQIEKNIRSRKIYIFGCNERAVRFVDNNKSKFDIAAFVSEGEDLIDAETRKILGAEIGIINWEKAVREKNTYFVFSAIPKRYEAMLLSEGLRWGYDFCYIEQFDFFITNKKIMIVAGHCQIDLLGGFMTQITDLTDKYSLFVLATNRQASRWTSQIIDFVRNICDVYVYLYTAPDARDKNRLLLNYNASFKYFMREELPADCTIYRIPNLASIRLYWPTMVAETMNPFYEYFRGSQHWLNRRHSPIYFTDEYLADRLDSGMEIADIIKIIDSDDMLNKYIVQNHMKRMMDILNHIDDGCDMKIGDFIIENTTKHMLFKDADHLQPVLAKEYLRRILDMLGLYNEKTKRELDNIFQFGNSAYDALDNHCSEVPVYRCVADSMQLEWWKKKEKYKTLLYSGTQDLTVEEYAAKYCEISLAMKKLQSIW